MDCEKSSRTSTKNEGKRRDESNSNVETKDLVQRRPDGALDALAGEKGNSKNGSGRWEVTAREKRGAGTDRATAAQFSEIQGKTMRGR